MKGELKKEIKNNNKQIEKILPKEYEIIDVLVNGRRIVVNLRQLMEISNTEDKSEILKAMNQSSSHYFYFGNVEIQLEDILNQKKEDFDIWMANKKSNFEDEKSETAKERMVLVEYEKEYREYTKEIRQLTMFHKQTEIAKKALEKSIEVIRSIGSFSRDSMRKPEAISDMV